MKKFFTQRLAFRSPLEVFPLVEKFSPQLLTSQTRAGRYSFLPFDPIEIFEIREGFALEDYKYMQKKFYEFKAQCQKEKGEQKSEKTFPFMGGICGVFTYDTSKIWENINWKVRTETNNLSYLALYQKFFVFDHKKNELFLGQWSENTPEDFDLSSLVLDNKRSKEVKIKEKKFLHEITKETYHEKFSLCQESIERGDSFQINFAQKFFASTKNTAWEIFLEATKKNPAQMMYYLPEQKNIPAIISCSPERLFSVDTHGKIFTQPIAGTRPRGKNQKEDDELEKELKSSEKEISEHSMIVDLLRNDTGKISEFGTVKVQDFARIEKYKTVMHLVSDIIGQKKKDISIFKVFEAFFPGGTITGTPKRETISILNTLEVSSRNFYCGSAGYFSICGSADFNILIRTIEKKGENISVKAGGGLVYGADWKSEYKETLHKFAGIEKIFYTKNT